MPSKKKIYWSSKVLRSIGMKRNMVEFLPVKGYMPLSKFQEITAFKNDF